MADTYTLRIQELVSERKQDLREASRARKRRNLALKERRWADARSALKVLRRQREQAQDKAKRISILRAERKKKNALVRALRHRRKAGKDAYGRQLYWFDGRKVLDIAYRHLSWARKNGWKGYLTSGYRTPEYSESLCYAMCGARSCAGRCAGRNSNHVKGAIDVSDYNTFERLMNKSPHRPKYINRLDWRDPVHFSVSGN